MTTSGIPDQRDLWIANYQETQAQQPSISTFAETCLSVLSPGSRILELGCGGGTDSAALASAGHTVIATDFVAEVIDSNRELFTHLPNLGFETMRIDEPYPHPIHTFDAVFAHLTLHYYPDIETRAIIREIRLVLKPGGWLMFACKSPQDPAWGKGIEIEPDMFNFHGKIRHFFSEAYARDLLTEGFADVQVQSHTGKLYRQRAGWITAIARVV